VNKEIYQDHNFLLFNKEKQCALYAVFDILHQGFNTTHLRSARNNLVANT